MSIKGVVMEADETLGIDWYLYIEIHYFMTQLSLFNIYTYHVFHPPEVGRSAPDLLQPPL